VWDWVAQLEEEIRWKFDLIRGWAAAQNRWRLHDDGGGSTMMAAARRRRRRRNVVLEIGWLLFLK